MARQGLLDGVGALAASLPLRDVKAGIPSSTGTYFWSMTALSDILCAFAGMPGRLAGNADPAICIDARLGRVQAR